MASEVDLLVDTAGGSICPACCSECGPVPLSQNTS